MPLPPYRDPFTTMSPEQFARHLKKLREGYDRGEREPTELPRRAPVEGQLGRLDITLDITLDYAPPRPDPMD